MLMFRPICESMKAVCLAAALLLPAVAIAQESEPEGGEELSETSDQAILKHEVVLEVGLAEAWDYFTDSRKLAQWMAPVVEVELRPGGTIRSNYDSCAAVGDEGTITLDIVNYVPQRILTLQSELESARGASWMNDTIYAERDNLYNVIEFQAEGENRTRIISWGLGYGATSDWDAMIKFFEIGNDWSYKQLHKAIAGEMVWPPCAN